MFVYKQQSSLWKCVLIPINVNKLPGEPVECCSERINNADAFQGLIWGKCLGCRHVYLFFAEMKTLVLKWRGVNFVPPLPSVQFTVWQLLVSLCVESWVSRDVRLMDQQPMEGGRPLAVDTVASLDYTHEMTLSPSSLPGTVSYNIVRCVRQPGVKGQLSTNEQAWRSGMNDVQFDASGNSSFPLICFCCVSFITRVLCPFLNPKSNVALPHAGLLMLLFNDCQDRWHLFVIYGLCEDLILGNMHYIYSLIWFLSAQS